MAVYDLMLKLEGMKALCGDGVTDDSLNLILFPTKELADRRSDLSRLKAGKLAFTERLKSILTEDFNARIAKNVLHGRNASPDGTGLIRNQDWERPIHEFFGHLARGLEAEMPTALARAHAAIVEAIDGLRQHREHDHALLVADYDPSAAERYRFPETARPVDPMELPPLHIRAGELMTAALVRSVSDTTARGWLFYVRNPDTREGIAQTHYIWDDDLSRVVFWHPVTPFEIPGGYVGSLPDFPAKATSLTGEVTAYLLVEPMESTAVAELIRAPDPGWNGVDAPSFEGFANLITARQRLFQKGNTRKQAEGHLRFPPPKLYIRRYRIRA